MPVDLPQRESDTTSCLQVLLAGIVDYAGLFPPARLDMAPTVRNYADFLDGEFAWMLGRLIVPAARLDELEERAGSLLPSSRDAEPWQFAAVVAPADDPQLEGHLERIAAFNETHTRPEAGLAEIHVIESSAPSAEAIERALDLMPDSIYPFFELSARADPRGLIAAISGCDAGAKVRTGGLRSDAYPRPEELAGFIAACAAADVPFKATAGLHHPLRHFSQDVETEEFGFLNVFVAAALAREGGLSESDLAAVLTDGSAASFVFGADSLLYKGTELTVEQIEETRMKFAVSFGSCSFIEPIDDLRAMSLL